MKIEKQIILGKATALVSFLIGSLIFGAYYFTSNTLFLFIGYGFIIIATITNLIILIANILSLKRNPNNSYKLYKTSGYILLNLPVLLIYLWFTLILTGTIRLNITNKTNHKIIKINITGCEPINIEDLKPNENKNIWITIKGDCSIALEYSKNGKLKKETVAGYVSSGMGKRIKHNIR